MSSDRDWLLKRLNHLNEDQIEYFIERAAIMFDSGMPTQQARAAALIELVDKMRL